MPATPPLPATASVSLNAETSRNVFWTLVERKHVQMNQLMSSQLLLVTGFKVKLQPELQKVAKKSDFSGYNQSKRRRDYFAARRDGKGQGQGQGLSRGSRRQKQRQVVLARERVQNFKKIKLELEEETCS